LQEASVKTVQELPGESAAAAGRISEQHDRPAWAAVAAVVGDDGPEVAFLHRATSGIEHRRRGLVHEQALRRRQMMEHAIADRLEMEAGAAGPVSQRRPIEPDPLSRVDLGLTIKRRVIAKLGDDHLGNGRLGRQPARHDMFGRVRLNDRAGATAAGVFRATRDQHPPLRRDHVETLARILADLRHGAAPART
jgi:hypothetical protein